MVYGTLYFFLYGVSILVTEIPLKAVELDLSNIAPEKSEQ
jgi:hypothetical protein